jgi:hypothetical protein
VSSHSETYYHGLLLLLLLQTCLHPKNNCRCNKRINPAISCGRIVKSKLNFAGKIENYNEEMEELNSLSGIFQNHGTFKNHVDFMIQLNEIIVTKSIIINDN